MNYDKPSDHPEFDPHIVDQIVSLQSQFSTGAEIAAQLLVAGVGIVPATLAFMHLGYAAAIYPESTSRKALHVENAPNTAKPTIFAWSEFFLPKVVWDTVVAE